MPRIRAHAINQYRRRVDPGASDAAALAAILRALSGGRRFRRSDGSELRWREDTPFAALVTRTEGRETVETIVGREAERTPAGTAPSVADLLFPVRGTGERPGPYALFGALSAAVAGLHGWAWLRIGPIERGSVRVRLPLARIPELVTLAGREIEGRSRRGHFTARFGSPRLEPLASASTLRAAVVTVRLLEREGGRFRERSLTREHFLDAAGRQLAERAPSGRLEIAPVAPDGSDPARRVVWIGGQSIVGYACTVEGLTDEDSLRLQAVGLGGRAHFGCGLFVPG